MRSIFANINNSLTRQRAGGSKPLTERKVSLEVEGKSKNFTRYEGVVRMQFDGTTFKEVPASKK